MHILPIVRPCFLVIDREFPGNISTRKLVIETAKFNVLTAYSSFEAVATLKAFPAVTGVVLDSGLTDMPCSQLIAQLKQVKPKIPIIAISVPGAADGEGADYYLESFNPTRLLELLQRLVPEAARAIEGQEEALNGGSPT
jgi:DNA-binding NtrC family response regulator